ncbi:MAG: HAD family phosphatase [Lachnospiraceae bacterium]|nr:HAD family phosphatase [Lachnospiraceae bacterium]
MTQNSGRYLFFSDLDDTLLTSDKKVSPKTLEALKRFVERGNCFIICSGRGLDSALCVQKELGLDFDHSYIAAYNGCQIYDCDNKKTIYKVGIPLNFVKEIFSMADEYGVYVHTYSDEYILCGRDDEEIQDYRKVVKTPVIVSPDPLSYLDSDPCKIICIELHDHEKQERFRKAITEKYGDILDTMYSSAYYLELIPKGNGKGKAVKVLADLLNVPISHTFAAGDAENDNSMLIAAGLGICMCNGAEGTKAVADVISTFDNNHDGLVEFLDRI